MLSRRGVSLIELLVGIVLMGIIGLALMRAFTGLMSASGAQVRIAATQGEARIGSLMLPQEFREIGYDTMPDVPGPATSDLLTIAPDQLSFYASRGVSTTCGTPDPMIFKVRRPVVGQRNPLLTDRVLLFLEVQVSNGLDDRWVEMDVTAIDLNSTCDGDPAIEFTVSDEPDLYPGEDMVVTNMQGGGPIRWFEEVEYAPVSSGGEWFVGRRSISLGEATFTPVIGPLSGSTGVGFTYYGVAGTALDPTTAAPRDVRSIGIRITTVTEGEVSLAGSTNRVIGVFPVVARVSLRNALRP
jgi:prepilin-type N-terminal cleavage/methylation domain-containing protein